MVEVASALRSALLFRKQRGALPQTLIFFVTSRCNARCAFCLYYEQITNPVAKSRELTVSEVERVAAGYGPLHYLALSGGEPFVRRDVAGLCMAFIDRCGTRVVDVPSNFFYTESMVDALGELVRAAPHVVFDIQLSLDDVGDAHDDSRKVKGLYARARETFAELARLRDDHDNLKLKVNVLWLEGNRDRLPRITDVIRRDFAADRVQLTYPHRTMPARGAPESLADLTAYERAADAVGRAVPPRRVGDLHSLGIRAVKPIYQRLLRDAVSGARPTGALCEAGRHLVVLDEKGDLFPCEPLWKPIGNVREHDYDVGAILRGAAYAEFRRQHLDGRCNCTWSCALNTHVSVTPSFLPRLGLEATRILGRRFLPVVE